MNSKEALQHCWHSNDPRVHLFGMRLSQLLLEVFQKNRVQSDLNVHQNDEVDIYMLELLSMLMEYMRNTIQRVVSSEVCKIQWLSLTLVCIRC
ncbi:hypothetical protein HMI56_003229 [Coelomomyces lativittatus]|nr:hypothetical protein HMI56_003229 [Coelomomyces lativittatus]